MLQARRLGNELLVGLHSDEAILENKGPTVMNLKERVAAIDACRWVTRVIPYAPYVTVLPWISHYGCWYVAHGDDITSDASGEDCYRFVKRAGRFKVFKRTPGISTTDLVGRMLLCTKTHFIKSLDKVLAGEEGPGTEPERKATGNEMKLRIKEYATDERGKDPFAEVWSWHPSNRSHSRSVSSSTHGRRRSSGEHHRHHQHQVRDDPGTFSKLVSGQGPREGQSVVYLDGGFDLFNPGHIEFLKSVNAMEEDAYVIAGVYNDGVINSVNGVNYPIMNIFERGLCVLQCKYIHAVIFNAPYIPTQSYFNSFPYGLPSAVYHEPASFAQLPNYDPHMFSKEMGIYREVPPPQSTYVGADGIVDRILKSRAMYEERQRVKGVKGLDEEAARRREIMEEEAKQMRLKGLERRWSEVERSYGA
jgi:ethanolamine-phosphate cytidylyltransferase